MRYPSRPSRARSRRAPASALVVLGAHQVAGAPVPRTRPAEVEVGADAGRAAPGGEDQRQREAPHAPAPRRSRGPSHGASSAQDGELRGQCGNDLQRVFVPFSLVFVQQARWTTTAGRRSVGGQVLLSTIVACPSAQVILRESSPSARAAAASSSAAGITAANAARRDS